MKESETITDEAVKAIAKLFDKCGTDAISHFCGHPIRNLRNVWAVVFDNGRQHVSTILPKELAEASAACLYFDETPPVVGWDDSGDTYIITRRVPEGN